MKAVFDPEYIRRINGPNVKTKGSKMDKALALMDDIAQFRESTGVFSRIVMIWCGSTEVFHRAAAGSWKTGRKFRRRGCATTIPGDRSQPDLRVRDALKSGVPFANGALPT